MATIPLTIQNATPPVVISIKADGDGTERYQDFQNGVASFSTVSDGFTRNFTVQVSKDSCSDSKTFSLNCPAPQQGDPEFTVTGSDPVCNNGALSAGFITISGVSNADRYRLAPGATYSGSNDCGNPQGSLSGGSTVVSVTAPPPGQSQTYTVRVWLGTNCGQWRDHTVSITSPACTPPSQNPYFDADVVNPTCTSGNLSTATLQIRNASNANRYFYSPGTTYSGSVDCANPMGTITGSSADISVPPPGSGQTAYYTIRVYNGSDCSSWYDRAVTVTSPTCTTDSNQPSYTISKTDPGCSGTARTGASITLSNVTGGDRYRYCLGSTYTCINDVNNPDGFITNGGATFSIPFPDGTTASTQDVTVRVYFTGLTYTDQTVTFALPACTVPSASICNFTASDSGQYAIKTYTYVHGGSSAITLYPNFSSLSMPDRFTIKRNGSLVYDTGCSGSQPSACVPPSNCIGPQNCFCKSIVVQPGETIDFVIDGTCSGAGEGSTGWNFKVTCQEPANRSGESIPGCNCTGKVTPI